MRDALRLDACRASVARIRICVRIGIHYRGIDVASGVSDARAVQSRIQIPASGTITGLASGRGPSAGDVYLINGSDFVQAGWYVGDSTTGLPYTTTPHFFYGEYYPGQPGNEVLHQGAALSWGAAFTVKVW